METRYPYRELAEEVPVAGVAPEVVEEVLDRVVRRATDVASRVTAAATIRARLLTVGAIGRASDAEDLCYYAVDSSYTSPALELVGGYLGLVFVVGVLYGRSCPSKSPEVSAYVSYDPTIDVTRLEARLVERRKALEALKAKDRGELDFDVLIVDGDVVPRLSPGLITGGGRESEIARELVRLTDAMVLIAEKTATPVVGVLKRSYSKDAIAVFDDVFGTKLYFDVQLSDRAFMTYVLEPGEYYVVGKYEDVARAYEKLVDEFGGSHRRELSPARYRLAWLKWVLRHSTAAGKMVVAFYRPFSGLSSTAVKVEYVLGGIDQVKLISSLAHVSEATGFPAPVDYADSLAQIPSDFRYTVYQLVLERIGSRDPEVASKLFTPVNPQKMGAIGLRS